MSNAPKRKFRFCRKAFLKGAIAGAVTAGLQLATATSINADLFAGGGGASLGVELALGHSPHIAINHDRAAIEMHAANHPDTLHYTEDVWSISPRIACRGLPIGILWASPACDHFSKARGGKPVERRIRSLAWVIVKWAKLPTWQRPRQIYVENVEEFLGWGPLMRDSRTPDEVKWIPNPARKGEIFKRWVKSLERLGYHVEWRILNAADYGVPTIRKRLFIIAKYGGEPIHWPEPTHAKANKKGEIPAGKLPWIPVHTCINWDLPCPSIFDPEERRRHGLKPELAPRTMQRVARGVIRYVIENEKPFIVRIGHWSNKTGEGTGFRGQGTDKPLSTISSINDKALISPTLIQVNHASNEQRGQDVLMPLHTITQKHGTGMAAAVLARLGNTGAKGDYVNKVDEPLRTIVSKNQDQLVTAFLAKNYTGVIGHGVERPLGVITSWDHHSLVTGNLVKLRGTCNGADANQPCPTITSQGTHIAAVQSLLIKHSTSGHSTVLSGDENKTRTAAVTGADKPRSSSRGRRGKNLEGETHSHQRKDGECDSVSGGAADEQRLPGSGILEKREGVPLAGSSHSLAAEEGTSSPRGCEPRGHEQAQQSSEKSDRDDSGRESSSRVSKRKNKSVSEMQNLEGKAPNCGGVEAGSGTVGETGSVDVSSGKNKGTEPRLPLAAVSASVVKFYGACRDGQPIDRPLDTVTAKARFGLVTVINAQTNEPELWQIVDIGMRMLQPSELLNAQFHPDVAKNFKLTGSKANQVARIGNSVPPLVVRALVMANNRKKVKAA